MRGTKRKISFVILDAKLLNSKRKRKKKEQFDIKEEK